MPEDKVRLRAVTEADLPNFIDWLSDPEVVQYTSAEARVRTLEEEREWFASVTAPDFRGKQWAIEAEGRHIGTCSLDWNEAKQVGSFGIIIGDKTAWDKGYGTAALLEVLSYGFAEAGLSRIFLDVFAGNFRALRCYEKCGFRCEGTQRQSFFKRGRWIDVHRMAILRPEWQARQCGLAPEQLLERPELVKEWWQCLEALNPQAEEVIVDAGCRDAKRSLLIAPYLLLNGKILGFDANADAIEQAQTAIAEKEMEAIVSAQVGDIRALPLQDDIADAWFCREVLEYLDNPEVALAEAVRVVKPGGRVVAVEADWDTLAYNATDKELERKFVAVHTDCGGGGSADGRTGRKLLSLFREAGLEEVTLQAHVRWSDDYSPETDYLCRPLGQGVVNRGCLSQEELDAFYADLSAQAQKGRYFHCYSYFICSGRVVK